MSFLRRLFARPYLWVNPHTGHYFDPDVLLRDLGDGEVSMARMRGLLHMPPVTLAGAGYAEAQVAEAYADFCAWLEKKSVKADPTPTSAPSTECLAPLHDSNGFISR